MFGNENTMQPNSMNDFAKDIENVNKLTTATNKLFGINNGGTDENFLPEIKDVL
jgi:hypothetical protein